MQQGFAAKQAKKKVKKAKAKAKKQALAAAKSIDAEQRAGSGDMDMAEAGAGDQAVAVMEADEIDYTMPKPGGSHKEQVSAKRALKVKVRQLKMNRSKLTKLPVNKAPRKQLSGKIKALVMEQQALSRKPAKRT